jgi:hypothetical protein
MPPEMNDVHKQLGEHGARLDAHQRELGGLWTKTDELSTEAKNDREAMTKVRIQVAVIVAAGLFAGGIMGAAINFITMQMLKRAMGVE